MSQDSIADLVRRTVADIADFEARMREVSPFYCVGDRVLHLGEAFEVASYDRGTPMPGYWLRAEDRKNLFLPIDLEGVLQPVVH